MILGAGRSLGAGNQNLPGKLLWTEESGGLQSTGSQSRTMTERPENQKASKRYCLCGQKRSRGIRDGANAQPTMKWFQLCSTFLGNGVPRVGCLVSSRVFSKRLLSVSKKSYAEYRPGKKKQVCNQRVLGRWSRISIFKGKMC